MGFFTKKKEKAVPPRSDRPNGFLTGLSELTEAYAKPKGEEFEHQRERDLLHDKRKADRQALRRQRECYARGYGWGYYDAEKPNYDQGWQDRGVHEQYYGRRQQVYGQQGHQGFGQQGYDDDDDDMSEGSSPRHHGHRSHGGHRRHHGHHRSHSHHRRHGHHRS